MNEPTIITVECKQCGKPVNLEFKRSGNRRYDDMMLNIAKGVLHNECAAEKKRRITEEELNLRIQQRAVDFRLMCPPQYQDSSEWIKTPEAQRKLNIRAMEEAIKWEYGAMGLNIHGKTSGTGKTTTAWLILEREFVAGRFIVALTHKEMSDRATLAATRITPESKRWADTLKRCDLLYIDDLGKSRFKSASGEGRAAEEFLFDLIDTRVVNKLPTIFTINMSGIELKAAMSGDKGAYFLRRLKDYFVRVAFDCESSPK